MRDLKSHYMQTDFDLSGRQALSPVEGRQYEVMLSFINDTTPIGIDFFKSSRGKATLKWDPAAAQVTVDMTSMPRLHNDDWSFKGVYASNLPEPVAKGQEMTLRMYVDHSIADVFVNDKWAFSVRLFPTDADADGLEAFADGSARVTRLEAWTLTAPEGSGVASYTGYGSSPTATASDAGLTVSGLEAGSTVNVYDATGMLIATARAASGSLDIETEASGLILIESISPAGERKTLKLLRN